MKKVPVFYTPMMVADFESYSPSAGKPRQVVASWGKQFPVEVFEPTPVTVEELERAHDPTFVKDILECRADNGFENKSPLVSKSLPYTSGAMLSAAKHALLSGKVAAAPCSGFHHAAYKKAEGFCTFNGLMITACALKAQGLTKPVGVLDLDMHYGNGTDDILRELSLKDNSDWCRHFTAGKQFQLPDQRTRFFEHWLPQVLEELSECSIVLFQAGADPHINDPQGGWLTTPELRRRDAVVFDTLAKAKVPVAWNLAGGYQVEKDGSIPKVLEVHDNTMRECVRVYVGAQK